MYMTMLAILLVIFAIAKEQFLILIQILVIRFAIFVTMKEL